MESCNINDSGQEIEVLGNSIHHATDLMYISEINTKYDWCVKKILINWLQITLFD